MARHSECCPCRFLCRYWRSRGRTCRPGAQTSQTLSSTLPVAGLGGAGRKLLVFLVEPDANGLECVSADPLPVRIGHQVVVIDSGKGLQLHAERGVSKIIPNKLAVCVRELSVLKWKGGVGSILLTYRKTGMKPAERMAQFVRAVPVGIGEIVVAGKAVRRSAW